MDPNKTFNLTLTLADLQALGLAINELKHGIAAPLIQKINEQVNAQIAAEQTPDEHHE